jgi:hypothetical protein
VDFTECLNIEQSGRAGRITVNIDGDVLSFDWELGASPVVAIIYVPSPEEWSLREPWRKLNRGEVLEALGREICRVKCRGCEHHFDETFLELRKPTASRSGH